jgi:hypothetical protein
LPAVERALSKLPDQHARALRWFAERAGETVGWPGALDDGTLLVCRPKGIYKPRWSEYALSIRQSLSSPYPDEAPHVGGSEPWTYRYFQESLAPGDRDAQFTNVALVRNHEDGVPVGVLIQVRAKPTPAYEVLGLGTVGKWEDGYFPITELG